MFLRHECFLRNFNDLWERLYLGSAMSQSDCSRDFISGASDRIAYWSCLQCVQNILRKVKKLSKVRQNRGL